LRATLAALAPSTQAATRWRWSVLLARCGREGGTSMANLVVGELSFELVTLLRPLLSGIKQQDRALEAQLKRAASSIALNIAG
jgi:hypothetical protein